MADLNINDYKYELPAERIALHPLQNRDASKLLVWKNGSITHSQFRKVADFLPPDSFLFFNDTKVIPARLHFKKETGAGIEIFLLNPLRPSPVMSEVMQTTAQCTWICTIGNLKRWNTGTTLYKTLGNTQLSATLENREEGIVTFRWTEKKSFAEIISLSGETPLPPYIRRNVAEEDRLRYQTVYAHHDGAVAAPTAGLHFTEEVLGEIKEKGIGRDFVTLHVSAGTFQPIKTDDANKHTMHAEQIVVTKQNLENLLTPGKRFIAVGTTSLRTLESLYWFGAKLLTGNDKQFIVRQDDPYLSDNHPSASQALSAIRKHMEETGVETLTGETSVFIKPGYKFRICSGLITNFHQPASTLILLVAAFTGDQHWKKIYDEAMKENYRFLSYGDSSLLLRE